MSEYDWHPVVALRWSADGKLQQHWKRRVCNKRGIWYDEFDWRDVPTEQPAQETPAVPPGHFWRGEINPMYCKNCGGHYDNHVHTDEASLCPPVDTGVRCTKCNSSSAVYAHISCNKPGCPGANREVTP